MRGNALCGALCDAEEDEEEVVMRAIVSDASRQFDAERIVALQGVAHQASSCGTPSSSIASHASGTSSANTAERNTRFQTPQHDKAACGAPSSNASSHAQRRTLRT
jgi:hypothetical protein